MSYKESAWVMDESPYKGTERMIHMVLGEWANDGHDWELWANQQKIADKAACSLRTVSSTVAKMVEDGYLKVIKQGRGQSHPVYQFLMPGNTDFGPGKIEENDEHCSDLNTQSAHGNTQSASENDGVSYSSKKRVLAPAARPRNEIFEALCREEGIDWNNSNSSELGPINKATGVLRKMEPRPTETDVHERAAAYRKLWPNATFTAIALVKHWSKFAPTTVPRVDCAAEVAEAWRIYDADGPDALWPYPDNYGQSLRGCPADYGFERP